MDDIIVIIISAMLVNNIILTKFLGLCPFFGVSKKTNSALAMSIAGISVMVLTGMLTWIIYRMVLVPLSLEYMKYVVFILFIASMVQIIEMIIKKFHNKMYEVLGIYLPLITTNCAIMGVALINLVSEYSFVEAVANSFGTGLGFMLALMIMSGIRERLELCDVPQSFRGVSIAFIIAFILTLSFAIFGGLV